MISFEEAEQAALVNNSELIVNDSIFDSEIRFICTSDMGWVMPINDISNALKLSKSTGHDVVSRNSHIFEPYLTSVRVTRMVNNQKSDNLKCLTREGMIMFLMKLTPDRMKDKDVASRVIEFQHWAVKIIGEKLDYYKVPQWWARREASKIKYKAMTEAIKDKIINNSDIPSDKQWLVYATEADMINVIIFGKTAKQAGCNQREKASHQQLDLIARFEDMNEGLIRLGVSIETRYDMITKIRDDLISNNRLPTDQFTNLLENNPGFSKYIGY